MKSYNQLIKEAEGFKGVYKPDYDPKKGAITLQNKLPPKKRFKPADKGSAIVKQKGGERVKKDAIGYPKKKGPGIPQGGGKLAKREPGGKIVRGTRGPTAVPDEKQVGKQPGTTRKKTRDFTALKKGLRAAGRGVGAVGRGAGAVGKAGLKGAGKVGKYAMNHIKAKEDPKIGFGDNVDIGGPRTFGGSAR